MYYDGFMVWKHIEQSGKTKKQSNKNGAHKRK